MASRFALSAAVTLMAGFALLVASPALGSSPPGHKVTICHATPPDTAKNGWNEITVDVASIGYQHAGHQSKHDADIIPPYRYDDFSFPGKNWTVEGQAIWANDCTAPPVEPKSTPTPTPTPMPTPTPTPTASPTEEPTGSVAPTEATNPTPTPSEDGAVLPAVGTPDVTLPPTDTGMPADSSGP